MQTGGVTPTNAFHIARAYGAPVPAVRPPAPVENVKSAQTPAQSEAAARIRSLVAAPVAGGIDFTVGDEPVPSGPALPMYRHPADRNMAATALSVGRTLDVSG